MELSPDELLLARSSPVGFGHVVSGGTRGQLGAYIPYRHLVLLNDELLKAIDEQDMVIAGWEATAETRGVGEAEARELCAGGRFDRLVVEMPPRHGKSETTSKYTPAWYLGSRPERKVILTSYEASFAETWGRKARDLLEEWGPEIFGVQVSQKSKAAKLWELADQEGAMVTAGAGGGITGKGAHLLLIDDPVKNEEEAASQVYRDKNWGWWLSTARTRLQQGGIVVVIQTRWHEDDLAGRMLLQDEDEEIPDDEQEGWRRLSLPAIAELDPDTGAFDDPLGRELGEPLCPELGFNERWAKRTRRAVGMYWWSALYQQRPRPAEGLLFKRKDFRYFRIDEDAGLYILEDDEGGLHPVGIDHCTHFQTADTAASEDEMADFSVVSTWAVTPDHDLLLVNVERERFEDIRVGGFVQMAYDDAVHQPAFISVENASSGPKVIRELGNKGYPIRSANPDTDKVTRALLAVARYEEHRVYHRRGAMWLIAFEGELLAFPNAAHDDQVDTVAYAAIELPRLEVLRRKRRRGQKAEMAGIRSKRL